MIKIATWNVNGIRARQAQLQEWIEREQPDILCLQEIKAVARSDSRRGSASSRATGATGTAAKGYSGVALHVSKALSPERPPLLHPAFDYESRIVTAESEG